MWSNGRISLGIHANWQRFLWKMSFKIIPKQMMKKNSVHVLGKVSQWINDIMSQSFTVPTDLSRIGGCDFLRIHDFICSNTNSDDHSFLLLNGVRPSMLNDKVLPIVMRIDKFSRKGAYIAIHSDFPLNRLEFSIFSNIPLLQNVFEQMEFSFRIDFYSF